ncbi:MAG: DUF4333 domain-containing protein [Solirubrobacteraceae bacterium]
MSDSSRRCQPVGAALLALVLTGAALAGCGGSGGSSSTATTAAPAGRTVDTQAVEKGIEQSLSTSSVKVTKASCPSDVPVKTGDTFTCTVTFSNGATGKAKVTQQGAGRYTYTLEDGSVQIPGSAVESQIEKSLALQGIPNATVNCPDNIIVKVGTTVTCNVSGATGGTGSVTFTFSSAEGTVDSSSVHTG